ncbi:MAG: hypothetical protein JSV00_06365, partial [bacterium]
MKWWNVNRAYRSTRRLARVLVVLIRYGFGEVLHRMNLARPALKVSRLVRRGTGPSPGLEGSVGERLRMALEELGPTFIKLGQLLATRPDLLPPDIIAQFQRLQRHVPPLPFSQIRPVIEQELGAPLESLFASFDEEPMGSASIAQVYRARLPWGRDAAVKVIKPGIEKQVMADLDILETLAVMLENRVEESRQFRPGKVVEQFRRSIRREMDLTFEAYSMVRFGQEFEGDESVLIPEVFWERCSSRILTMELMEG